MQNISPWLTTELSPSQIHLPVSLTYKLCSSMLFWPRPLLVPATSSTQRIPPPPANPPLLFYLPEGILEPVGLMEAGLKRCCPRRRDRRRKRRRSRLLRLALSKITRNGFLSIISRRKALQQGNERHKRRSLHASISQSPKICSHLDVQVKIQVTFSIRTSLKIRLDLLPGGSRLNFPASPAYPHTRPRGGHEIERS